MPQPYENLWHPYNEDCEAGLWTTVSVEWHHDRRCIIFSCLIMHVRGIVGYAAHQSVVGTAEKRAEGELSHMTYNWVLYTSRRQSYLADLYKYWNKKQGSTEDIFKFSFVLIVLAFREDGSFVIHNVPSGSYVIEVLSPNFSYEPVRVEINSKGKLRARKVNYIQTSQVVPVPYPLKLKCLGQTRYFYTREQWRATDFLFNPMVSFK